jgi:hypothetical protein
VPIVPVHGSLRSRLGGTHGGAGGVENACLEKSSKLDRYRLLSVGRLGRDGHDGWVTVKVVHFHVIASI